MKNIFYRKRLNSKLLNIDLPKELQNQEVELIILPCESNEEVGKEKGNLLNSVKGLWSDSEVDLDEIREKAWKR